MVRRLFIAACAIATVVGFAGPAHAAMSVRANWTMHSLPTMVDAAGRDNNGTTSGLTLVDVTSTNKGYQFDSSTDYATAPDAANLDPETASIRVSARITFTRPLDVGETYDIVRKGLSTTSGGYYKIEIKKLSSGASVASCRFKDASGVYGEAKGTIDLTGKGWVTIVCTKTATQIKITAAGQTAALTRSLGSISNASAVLIGGKGDSTDSFPGLMDFVKIEIG
jgi:hypothetical protein